MNQRVKHKKKPLNTEEKTCMTLRMVMTSEIQHKSHNPGKQLINWTSSKLKTPALRETPLR